MGKHSNLLDPFVNYRENKLLQILPQIYNMATHQADQYFVMKFPEAGSLNIPVWLKQNNTVNKFVTIVVTNLDTLKLQLGMSFC